MLTFAGNKQDLYRITNWSISININYTTIERIAGHEQTEFHSNPYFWV